MIRRLLAAAICVFTGCASSSNRSLRAEDFVEFEPAAVGKSSGPVGIRVRYPLAHPVGEALPLEVDVWTTDGDAAELTVAARAEKGVTLKSGEKSARFEGPIRAREVRTHRFVFVPDQRGTSYLNIDAGRLREGDAAHRTVTVQIEGGGRIDPPQGGKPPAQPIRME